MEKNFDKILGAVSLLFGVIFVVLAFLEISGTIYLTISIVYFIFAVISLFSRVRRNGVQEAQEQDGGLAGTDTQEKRDEID